ncbi:MAG TPA: hypothetical protein VMH24_05715 [Candidatus Sulfotelmatobacter sp.]|nr:hypothetical protein [Candidatus Sulfotelmatobacter sp.]
MGYLLIRGSGRLADRRTLGRIPRLVAAVILGILLGGVNPYGLHLLTYPLVTLTHHQAFAHIVEWQSPSFANPVNALFLAQVLVALILLVVRRGSIEDALVVSLFAASAMFASRNVPLAALASTPVLARGLAGLGSFAGIRRSAISAAAFSAACGLGAVLVVSALQRPAYDLSAYPVSEITWMQRHGITPTRVAAPDYVGNYLEFRFGVGAKVLMDDRVDMFPSSVQRAYTTLLAGSGGWQGVLSGPLRPSAVLWPRNEPLAGLVAEDPQWRLVLKDRRWIVAVPATSPVTVVRAPG